MPWRAHRRTSGVQSDLGLFDTPKIPDDISVSEAKGLVTISTSTVIENASRDYECLYNQASETSHRTNSLDLDYLTTNSSLSTKRKIAQSKSTLWESLQSISIDVRRSAGRYLSVQDLEAAARQAVHPRRLWNSIRHLMEDDLGRVIDTVFFVYTDKPAML